MRPLTHRFPQQSVGGQARAEKYTTFGKYFIDSFGHYCMACEAPLSTDMQVDHRLGSVLPHGFQTLKREEREKKEAEVDEMLGAENALLFRDSESFETAFMALCPKCNNCKNRGISPKDVVGTVKPLARPVQAAGSILWPDFDNTFLAFRYEESGEISVDEDAICAAFRYEESGEISVDEEAIRANKFYVEDEIPKKSKVESVILRARRTIELYNWNGSLGALNQPDAPRVHSTRSSARNDEQPEAMVSRFNEASDLRKLNRRAAYQRATAAMARYAPLDPDRRELLWQQIADTIIATGYWSLWLKVFLSQEDQATQAELCGKMFVSPITDHFKSTSTCVSWDKSEKALICGRAQKPEIQLRKEGWNETSTADYLALFKKQLPIKDMQLSVPKQDDSMAVDPPEIVNGASVAPARSVLDAGSAVKRSRSDEVRDEPSEKKQRTEQQSSRSPVLPRDMQLPTKDMQLSVPKQDDSMAVDPPEIVNGASVAPARSVLDAGSAVKRKRSDEVRDDDEPSEKKQRTEQQSWRSPVLPRDAIANARDILSTPLRLHQRSQSSDEGDGGGARPTSSPAPRRGGRRKTRGTRW